MSKPFAIVTGASSGIGLELAAIVGRADGAIGKVRQPSLNPS